VCSDQTASAAQTAKLLLFSVPLDKVGEAAGILVSLCAGTGNGKVWGCAFSPEATSDFVAVDSPVEAGKLWDKFAHGVIFGEAACLYWRRTADALQCALLCAASAEAKFALPVSDQQIQSVCVEKVADVQIPLLGLAGLSTGDFWEARIPKPIKYAGLTGQQGQRPVLRAVCYRSEDMTGLYWTRYVDVKLMGGTE